MAQLTLPGRSAQLRPLSRIWSHLAELASWLVPAGIILLGLALRLLRVDDYSMWVDEVYTVEYSRLPWVEVLGLNGAYDNHPPLYYAVVKAFALVFPETVAARAFSVLTGTATIVVMYLITKMLVNRPAALLSSLILAISPLHIWYSQDGRMYAPTAFMVCLSYYLLLRLLGNPGVWAGTAYGVSLLVAMLMDYSALYGLAPQAALVAYISWQNRRWPKEWLVVSGAAGIIYLPWAIQVVRTIIEIPGARDFLFVTRTKIFDSILTVMGLPGRASYYWGDVSTPWSEWSQIRPAAVALVAAILFLSAVTLCGRYRLAFITGISLLLGTVITAAVMSYLISPGYADRTVLFAVFGWVLLAGSAPFGRVPNGARSISLVAITGLLVLSSVSLGNIYLDAQKEPYKSAALTAAGGALYGMPIYADEFMFTAISAYDGDVVVRSADELGRAPALMHSYGDYVWRESENLAVHEELEDQGYERVLHQKFPDPWSTAPTVDVYVRESANLGEAFDLPRWPVGYERHGEDVGWQLLASETEVETSVTGRQELVIYGSSLAERPASIAVPAAGDHLYLISLDYWIEIPTVGSAAVTLTCTAPDDGSLLTLTTQLTAEALEDPGWQRARTGIICPSESTALRLSLSNAAVGELRFRNIRGSEVSPAA
jgi:4-amino-4-deoxy-L-arabinose transferase-like glycosyltransferase